MTLWRTLPHLHASSCGIAKAVCSRPKMSSWRSRRTGTCGSRAWATRPPSSKRSESRLRLRSRSTDSECSRSARRRREGEQLCRCAADGQRGRYALSALVQRGVPLADGRTASVLAFYMQRHD